MTSSTQPAVVGATIEFLDGRQVRWTVREYAECGSGERVEKPCLVFESMSAVRRVRIFPPDWRELDHAALLALSWRT